MQPRRSFLWFAFLVAALVFATASIDGIQAASKKKAAKEDANRIDRGGKTSRSGGTRQEPAREPPRLGIGPLGDGQWPVVRCRDDEPNRQSPRGKETLLLRAVELPSRDQGHGFPHLDLQLFGILPSQACRQHVLGADLT